MFKPLNIKEYFQDEKDKLKKIAQGKYFKLAIIDGTAADDEPNKIYIRNKIKDFEEMNWSVCVLPVLEETTVQETINKAIEKEKATAIIVQTPLRPDLRDEVWKIPNEMDVDGFNPESLFNPATPQGIIDYLEASGYEFEGKSAIVLGRSNIVGKPMARMLLDKDMTVSICHSKTPSNIKVRLLDNANLVVCAIGKPYSLYRQECPNAFVIDVGINRIEADGKMKTIGDFKENPLYQSSSTPVPGGVGLLTRLALMKNVARTAK